MSRLRFHLTFLRYSDQIFRALFITLIDSRRKYEHIEWSAHARSINGYLRIVGKLTNCGGVIWDGPA